MESIGIHFKGQPWWYRQLFLAESQAIVFVKSSLGDANTQPGLRSAALGEYRALCHELYLSAGASLIHSHLIVSKEAETLVTGSHI